MARCPTRLYDDPRGDQPRGPEIVRHADQVVGGHPILPFVQDAVVLIGVKSDK